LIGHQGKIVPHLNDFHSLNLVLFCARDSICSVRYWSGRLLMLIPPGHQLRASFREWAPASLSEMAPRLTTHWHYDQIEHAGNRQSGRDFIHQDEKSVRSGWIRPVVLSSSRAERGKKSMIIRHICCVDRHYYTSNKPTVATSIVQCLRAHF